MDILQLMQHQIARYSLSKITMNMDYCRMVNSIILVLIQGAYK